MLFTVLYERTISSENWFASHFSSILRKAVDASAVLCISYYTLDRKNVCTKLNRQFCAKPSLLLQSLCETSLHAIHTRPNIFCTTLTVNSAKSPRCFSAKFLFEHVVSRTTNTSERLHNIVYFTKSRRCFLQFLFFFFVNTPSYALHNRQITQIFAYFTDFSSVYD